MTKATALRALLSVLVILGTERAAHPQSPGNIHRIGILSMRDQAAASEPSFEAFRRRLRDAGYVEGRDVTIEWRFAQGRVDRLPALAAEMINAKLDVILAASNPVVAALAGATKTIPIVMLSVSDPVGNGYVASLARPGGNITGLSNAAEYLSEKRLEILKEIRPAASRVAVLRTPIIAAPGSTLLRTTQAAAKALGLDLLVVDTSGPDDFERAFGEIAAARADAIVVLPDGTTLANREKILALAARFRLPGMYAFSQIVRDGGLIAYSDDFEDMYRLSADYVVKIFKGVQPAALPVAQPTKFELVVNLKTAKALGITIPPSILLRADEVIE